MPENIYQDRFSSYSQRQIQTFEGLLKENATTDIEKNFEYNPGKKASYFDEVAWNIYALLSKHYRLQGLEGKKCWLQAHRHTVAIAKELAAMEMPTSDERDKEGQKISILDFLLQNANNRNFSKIKLTTNFDFVFLDRSNNEIFKFNARNLRRRGLLESSRTRKQEVQSDVQSILTSPISTLFPVITPPDIPEHRDTNRPFSILETLRLTKKPPRIIEYKFRHLNLCSGYAISLLAQEYGVDKIERMGLIEHGKIPNAWDLKKEGLKKGGITVTADVTETLKQRRDKKLNIKDRAAYLAAIQQFFDNADSQSSPSLITAYLTNTRYAEKINAANEGRSEEERSLNSHVLVCLGREEPQRAEFSVIKGRKDLRYFLWAKTKIKPAMMRYLKVTVECRNGDHVQVQKDGSAVITKADGSVETKPNLRRLYLEEGDIVTWRDVLVSDFYRGRERIMGLAYYASQSDVILMENLSLNGVEDKFKDSEYEAIDYFQIEKGSSLNWQLKRRLNYSDEDIYYYVTALLDCGINLNRIREKDLLPIFDLQKIRESIDAKGGPTKIRTEIRKERLAEHNERDFRGFFIKIEAGKSPWEHIKKYFEPDFQGKNALTQTEREFIIRAIDFSCPNIRISLTPIKFEAGDMIYLTHMKIYEIKKYLLEEQAKMFNEEDYVKFIVAGDNVDKFIEECVNDMAFNGMVFSQFDEVERGYLRKAFGTNNPDLNPTELQIGNRMIFRKQDLEKCLTKIQERKKEKELRIKLLEDTYYVQTIREGDTPESFIENCLGQATATCNIDGLDYENLGYSELSSTERQYLFEALRLSNEKYGETDLTIVKAGNKETWKNFRIGAKILFNKKYLKKCIEDILALRKSLESQGLASITIQPSKGAKLEDIEIPEKLHTLIQKFYPGNNVEEAIIRNMLHFIYANEQGRGSLRRIAKEIYSYVGTIRSTGILQIRPTMQDVEHCKKIFRQYRMPIPENEEQLMHAVRYNWAYSVVIAGERLKDNLSIFKNYANTLGEELNPLDENLMLMLATSYNRSPAATLRASYQNWALNLASTAGIQAGFSRSDVDPLLKSPRIKEKLIENVRKTFKKVAETLIARGEITFDGDLDTEINKILSSNIAFLKGPLFQALQEWYKTKHGESLRITWTQEELAAGNMVFSYGQRLFRGDGTWERTFVNFETAGSQYKKMQEGFTPPEGDENEETDRELTAHDRRIKQLTEEMQEDYEPIEREVLPIALESPLPEIERKEAERYAKILAESGVERYFQDSRKKTLRVYSSKLNIRNAPNGTKIAQAKFGEILIYQSIVKRGSEYWLKVKKENDPGVEGYILFRPRWVSNIDGPRIPDKFRKRLESANSRMPNDYVDTMNDYLRFLENFSEEAMERSKGLMQHSKQTATIVTNERQRNIILHTARLQGYTGQRFFGILPKAHQRLFVIDTQNDRIISFKVSTGSGGKKETPRGRYIATGTGFQAVDAMGKHQGTYAKKYRGHIVRNFSGGKERIGRKKVHASMITTLIPIRRYGAHESEGRYFHGTNREHQLGRKASGGCIRMSNIDSVYLAALLNGHDMRFSITNYLYATT